jgi:hypothetical protein
MAKMAMMTKGIMAMTRFKRRTSLCVNRPIPTINFVPEGVKTKWFRDPNTGYWIQIEKPTSNKLKISDFKINFNGVGVAD